MVDTGPLEQLGDDLGIDAGDRILSREILAMAGHAEGWEVLSQQVDLYLIAAGKRGRQEGRKASNRVGNRRWRLLFLLDIF
ncbi:hypothetical protein [Pseudomonas sp.]|uniref:hypothetical protein n=1 Tax=Pseudomonas sp. TaxID=306 RepID=UPI0028B136F8|nr:hypothetical protein [Pseudomonas sp.]